MFDLNELIEFNEAIIYTFEPKLSGDGIIAESRNIKNAFIPEHLQYSDMLDAYLYAQNVMLPAFRADIVAPAQLELFLKTLYTFMGRTLALYPEQRPGDDSQQIECREHHVERAAAMATFTEKIITAFYECNRDDLDAVCHFLATTFYMLTDIHPFANANDHTATCLINVFLRVWDYPSILLHYPSEREDKNSMYAKTDGAADLQKALAVLIKRRILEAKETTFADEPRKTYVSLNVSTAECLARIQKKYPYFDIECILEESAISDEKYSRDETAKKLLLSAKMFMLAANYEEQCRKKESIAHRKMVSTGVSFESTLSSSKVDLSAALTTLSAAAGWKWNQTKGVAWIELKDIALAQAVYDRLYDKGIATVTLARRRDDPTIHVVLCKNLAISTCLLEAEKKAMEASAAAPMPK